MDVGSCLFRSGCLAAFAWMGHGENEMADDYRKPVASHGGDETDVVFCDDGSAWLYDWRKKKWNEMAPIPGSQRAAERK